MKTRRALPGRRRPGANVARVGALVAAVTLGHGHAGASPTVWEVAREPERGRADRLLAVAERSRVPAQDVLSDLTLRSRGASEELGRQLNARAAALITIADGAQLPDVRLLFLLGDALVNADHAYLQEGRQRLEEALRAAPDSPLAGDAWASLALAAGKLGDFDAQRRAYTRALDHEWRREWRANLLLNRGEAQMLAGDLQRAQRDYQRSMSLSRSTQTRALSGWGLAVATERDDDLPTALELARKAASFRFGSTGHPVVALDLPNIFFTPEYEEHYYRALSAMAEGRAEPDVERARLLLQTARLLWSLYIDGARQDDAVWLENARRHRLDCQHRVEALTAPDEE